MSKDRLRLTRDQVVRHVLGKHHLLRAAGSGELVRVVDDLVGLHGTSATSPHLSLHARVRAGSRQSSLIASCISAAPCSA